MGSFLTWTLVFFVACAAIVNGFPGSQKSPEPSTFRPAVNVDYQWLTHIKQAPVQVSFHDEEGYVQKYPNFDNLMKSILAVLLCPLYVNLNLPNGDPLKNQTAVVFNAEDAKVSTILLTDNKTHFVAAGWKGENTVTVFRFVDPLPAIEETKIKKLLEEVKYKVQPTFDIRLDTCN